MNEMKTNRNFYVWLIWQIAAWAILVAIPSLLDFVSYFDIHQSAHVLKMSFSFSCPLALFYLVNFFILVPRFLYKQKILAFWAINLCWIALSVVSIVSIFSIYNKIDHWDNNFGLYMAVFGIMFMYMFILGFSVGMSYVKRSGEIRLRLQEEQKKNAEAELVWLKNQLNPHFLFNTLNNISSLVRVDADVAQDSIGQLSDLLRYTLYESNKPLVPIEGEIEFMENYIDLMKLRCNDLAKIETDMRVPLKPLKVVPLLFICLIENAFKHGVNSRMPSFVKIKLLAEGNDLTFSCENSLHPKPAVDRSGSGIGLENLRRRLELTYPERYEYIQESTDKTYSVTIRLKDCV